MEIQTCPPLTYLHPNLLDTGHWPVDRPPDGSHTTASRQQGQMSLSTALHSSGIPDRTHALGPQTGSLAD